VDITPRSPLRRPRAWREQRQGASTHATGIFLVQRFDAAGVFSHVGGTGYILTNIRISWQFASLGLATLAGLVSGSIVFKFHGETDAFK